jgi:hypothetical protein
MVRKATSLILVAGLVLSAVPGGAQVFGPDTVWGSVPSYASDAANAVLLDGAGRTLLTVPVFEGKFAFRNASPGQYAVALQSGSGRELARSLPVDLAAGLEAEAIFDRDRLPAAIPPSSTPPPVTTGGGIGTTGWILIGAAAAGITTAVIIVAQNENVASPSR